MNEMRTTLDKVHKHGERVGVLAYRLAQKLGLPEEFWLFALIAGRWHDYGKMTIPVEILNKRGKLDEDEWDKMRDHPVTSYILLKVCKFNADIAEAVLHHHEDYSGTGYPAGLIGDNIPIGSRLIRICDVFDALTEERIYKKGLSVQEALSIMDKDNAMGKYDPDIYQVFRAMVLEEEEDDAEKDYTDRLHIIPDTGGIVVLKPKGESGRSHASSIGRENGSEERCG